MKKYILLLFIASLSFNTYAQNTEMAKAFYKKALQAYEDKNYEETLKLIEKTKENLNGNTNPDIIYIEAKSRFENDININEAKELFNQFLNESSATDERRDEVSSILVDVETSSKYSDNGFKRKVKKYTKGELYNYSIIFRNQQGVIKKSAFYDKNDKVTAAVYKVKKNSIQIYDNNYDWRVRITNNTETEQRLIFDHKNVTNCISFISMNLNQKKIYLKISDIKILEVYADESLEPISEHKNFKIGLIKKVITNKKKIYTFDKSGIPLEKGYYKRNEMKITHKYNKETDEWIKQ